MKKGCTHSLEAFQEAQPPVLVSPTPPPHLPWLRPQTAGNPDESSLILLGIKRKTAHSRDCEPPPCCFPGEAGAAAGGVRNLFQEVEPWPSLPLPNDPKEIDAVLQRK
jgi:hypothetical protein